MPLTSSETGRWCEMKRSSNIVSARIFISTRAQSAGTACVVVVAVVVGDASGVAQSSQAAGVDGATEVMAAAGAAEQGWVVPPSGAPGRPQPCRAGADWHARTTAFPRRWFGAGLAGQQFVPLVRFGWAVGLWDAGGVSCRSRVRVVPGEMTVCDVSVAWGAGVPAAQQWRRGVGGRRLATSNQADPALPAKRQSAAALAPRRRAAARISSLFRVWYEDHPRFEKAGRAARGR